MAFRKDLAKREVIVNDYLSLCLIQIISNYFINNKNRCSLLETSNKLQQPNTI